MVDIIAGLDSVTKVERDLQSIVNSAHKSLKVIGPWLEARASNPALEKVVQSLRRHSQDYCTALDQSIQTAQDGQTFSTKAIDLCDFLLDDDAGTSDLIEYIEDMQSGAKKAHDDSESTMKMFRSVRVGVHEIIRDTSIPQQLDTLTKEQGSKTKGFTVPFFGRKKDTSAESADRNLDFNRAVEELQQAAADLEALQDSVGKFADWWVIMNGKLSTADTRAEALDAAKKKKLQIRALQKGWKAIYEDYVIYNVKIAELQDFYPTSQPKLVK